MRAIRLYIASSFRNLHAVRLFGRALNTSDFELLDWTAKAKPPEGLTPAERRMWMDADHGGEDDEGTEHGDDGAGYGDDYYG